MVQRMCACLLLPAKVSPLLVFFEVFLSLFLQKLMGF
jgi:hypothetical protein